MKNSATIFLNTKNRNSDTQTNGSANMHIMILAPTNSPFGIRFLKLLLENGYAVTFVGDRNPLPGGNPRYRFFIYPGMLGKKVKYDTINRLTHLLRISYLGLIAHIVKPDLVHVHHIDIRAYECARANLHPLVLTAWGSDINNLFIPSIISAATREHIIEALASADHVTADASDILEKCESLIGHKLNKSILLYGIDFNFFKPGLEKEAQHLKEQLGISAEHRIILSVRTLKPLYCHDYILEAFADLLTDPQYHSCRLILKQYKTYSDEYEHKLRDLANQLGVAERVIWIPCLPDESIPSLYALADVVVSYPERDGFPVSFLEAAACKRPLISSGLPAYANVFPPNSFWMIPPKNVQELSRTLKTVLKADNTEFQQRIECAYETAHQIGTWQQTVKTANELYQKAMKNIQR
jgi:glycosyltransferase involved in cell wall biosynthesis